MSGVPTTRVSQPGETRRSEAHTGPDQPVATDGGTACHRPDRITPQADAAETPHAEITKAPADIVSPRWLVEMLLRRVDDLETALAAVPQGRRA